MALTLGEAARRTGRAKSSLRRALNLGRIAGRKTASGEWEVDEASLFAAYPPPGDALGKRPGHAGDAGELVQVLRESLEREREINRQLHAELERERADRDRDRALFRELADEWKRQLPPPAATDEARQEPPWRAWWRRWRR